MSACAAHEPARYYTFPARPDQYVARLTWGSAGAGAYPVKINGHIVNLKRTTGDILPGKTTVECGLHLGRLRHTKPLKVTFNAEAGHKYALKHTIGKREGKTTWEPYVEDLGPIQVEKPVGANAPLYIASYRGDLQKVRELTERGGTDVNAKTREGWTALHAASTGGHQDVVRLLLENGADINAKAGGGWYGQDWTALHAASIGGHQDVVRLLLENGADINAKAGGDLTALHSASIRGHQDVVRLLLEKGADINAKAESGRTALMYASEFGHIDSAKLLVENGADINAKATDGWTALIGASSKGHQDVVRLLLGNRADINAKTLLGRTALHFASASGHRGIVELLVESGADVNAKTNQWIIIKDTTEVSRSGRIRVYNDVENQLSPGQTPLMLASKYGHIDVARLLVENGADVNAKASDGRTALMSASREGHQDVVEFLKKNGAD